MWNMPRISCSLVSVSGPCTALRTRYVCSYWFFHPPSLIVCGSVPVHGDDLGRCEDEFLRATRQRVSWRPRLVKSVWGRSHSAGPCRVGHLIRWSIAVPSTYVDNVATDRDNTNTWSDDPSVSLSLSTFRDRLFILASKRCRSS